MTVEFRGHEVQLGKDTLILPPLNLEQLEEFSEKLENLPTMRMPEQIKAMGEIVYAALTRNYPGLDQADFKRRADGNFLTDCIKQALIQSGLQPVGEQKPGRGPGSRK